MLKDKKNKRPRPPKPKSDYKPVFTSAEYKLLLKYGPGDLLEEIGLIRVQLMRTMIKMNEEMPNLSLRDHFDALRVMSYATGHITRQLEVRERLMKPYQELEKEKQALEEQFDDFIEEIRKIADGIYVDVYGQEKWEDMQFDQFVKEAQQELAQKKCRY